MRRITDRTMVVEARQGQESSRQIAITQLHMQPVETTYWKRETQDSEQLSSAILSYITRHFNFYFLQIPHVPCFMFMWSMSKRAAKKTRPTHKAELSPSHVRRVNRNLLAATVFVWAIVNSCIDTAISPVCTSSTSISLAC